MSFQNKLNSIIINKFQSLNINYNDHFNANLNFPFLTLLSKNNILSIFLIINFQKKYFLLNLSQLKIQDVKSFYWGITNNNNLKTLITCNFNNNINIFQFSIPFLNSNLSSIQNFNPQDIQVIQVDSDDSQKDNIYSEGVILNLTRKKKPNSIDEKSYFKTSKNLYQNNQNFSNKKFLKIKIYHHEIKPHIFERILSSQKITDSIRSLDILGSKINEYQEEMKNLIIMNNSVLFITKINNKQFYCSKIIFLTIQKENPISNFYWKDPFLLAISSIQNIIYLWKISKCEKIALIKSNILRFYQDKIITHLTFSDDNTKIAIFLSNGLLEIINLDYYFRKNFSSLFCEKEKFILFNRKNDTHQFIFNFNLPEKTSSLKNDSKINSNSNSNPILLNSSKKTKKLEKKKQKMERKIKKKMEKKFKLQKTKMNKFKSQKNKPKKEMTTKHLKTSSLSSNQGFSDETQSEINQESNGNEDDDFSEIDELEESNDLRFGYSNQNNRFVHEWGFGKSIIDNETFGFDYPHSKEQICFLDHWYNIFPKENRRKEPWKQRFSPEWSSKSRHHFKSHLNGIHFANLWTEYNRTENLTDENTDEKTTQLTMFSDLIKMKSPYQSLEYLVYAFVESSKKWIRVDDPNELPNLIDPNEENTRFQLFSFNFNSSHLGLQYQTNWDNEQFMYSLFVGNSHQNSGVILNQERESLLLKPSFDFFYFLKKNKIHLNLFNLSIERLLNTTLILQNPELVESLYDLNNLDSSQLVVDMIKFGLESQDIRLIQASFSKINTENTILGLRKIISILHKKPNFFFSQFCLHLISFSLNLSINLLLSLFERLFENDENDTVSQKIIFSTNSQKWKFSYFGNGKLENIERTHNCIQRLRALMEELNQYLFETDERIEEEKQVINLNGNQLLSFGIQSKLITQKLQIDLVPDFKTISFPRFVLNCIIDGKISLLVSLLNHFSIPTSDIINNQDDIIDFIKTLCFKFVYLSISQQNLEMAIKLLENIGEDHFKIFKNLALYTTRREMAILLTNFLLVNSKFSESEKKNIQFIDYIHQIYPSTEYNSQIQIHKLANAQNDTTNLFQAMEQKQFIWTKTRQFKNEWDFNRNEYLQNIAFSLQNYFHDLHENVEIDENENQNEILRIFKKNYSEINQDVVIQDPDHQKVSDKRSAFGYFVSRFHWILNWNLSTKQRLILEKFHHEKMMIMKKSEQSIKELNINLYTRLRYFVAHHNIQEIESTINQFLTLSHQYPKSWGFKWNQISNILSLCPKSLQERISKMFGKFGIYFGIDERKFSNLLLKLCQTENLFYLYSTDKPDFISKYKHLSKKSEEIFEKIIPSQNMSQFHNWFINICSQNNLSNIMIHYLNHFELKLVPENLNSSQNNKVWVNQFILFEKHSFDPNFKNIQDITFLSVAKYLGMNISDVNINRIILENKAVLALSIVMNSETNLVSSFVLSPKEILCLNFEVISKQVQNLSPKFYSFLNTMSFIRNIQNRNQEKSRYKVRNGNKNLFSIRKDCSLLSIVDQSTPIKIKIICDNQESFINFDNNSFGDDIHHEELDSLFYLIKGNSIQAYSQLIKTTPSLKKKAFNQNEQQNLVQMITLVALQNLFNNFIVGACYSILEMNSLPTNEFCINISASKRILLYSTMKKDDIFVGNEKNPFLFANQKLSEFKQNYLMTTNTIHQSHQKILSMFKSLITQKLPQNEIIRIEEMLIKATEFFSNEKQKRAVLDLKELDRFYDDEPWKLVSLFTELNGIELYENNLFRIAKSCNWMKFLYSAEIQQFPLKRLKQIIKKFVEREDIKSHLLIVVNLLLSQNPENEAYLKEKRRSKFQTTTENISSKKGNDSKRNTKISPKKIMHKILRFSQNPTTTYLMQNSIVTKQPILSLAMSCFPNNSKVDCLMSYLFSICQNELFADFGYKMSKIVDYGIFAIRDSNNNIFKWTLDDLHKIVIILTNSNKLFALIQALRLFDPQNLLLPFLLFVHCVNQNRFSSAEKHLVYFVKEYQSAESRELFSKKKTIPVFNGSARKDANEISMFMNIQWIYQTASDLISHLIEKRDTFTTRKILEIANNVGFSHEFSKFYHIDQVFEKVENEVSGLNVLKSDYENLCILIFHDKFTEARQFAAITNFSIFQIALLEVYKLIEKYREHRMWKVKKEREILWQKCNKLLRKYSNDSQLCGDFFLSQIFQFQDEFTLKDQLTLLKYSLMWFSGEMQTRIEEKEKEQKPTQTSKKNKHQKYNHKQEDDLIMKFNQYSTSRMKMDDFIHDLNLRIWIISILNEIHFPRTPEFLFKTIPHPSAQFESIRRECIFFIPKNISHLRNYQKEFENHRRNTTNQNQEGESIPKYESLSKIKLTIQDCESLDVMIGHLLNKRKIDEVDKICQEFNYNSFDLYIIQACLFIANCDKSSTVKEVLNSSKLSNSVHNIINILKTSSPSINFARVSLVEIMELLLQSVKYAQDFCQQIVTNYIVSNEIHREYKEIEKKPNQTLLLLFSQGKEKFAIIKRFISNNILDREKIVKLFANKYYKAIVFKFQQKVEFKRVPRIFDMDTKQAKGEVQEHRQKSSPNRNADLQKEIPNEKILTGIISMISNQEDVLNFVNLTNAPHAFADRLLDILFSNEHTFETEVEILVSAYQIYNTAFSVEGCLRIFKIMNERISKYIEKEKYNLLTRIILGINEYFEIERLFEILFSKNKFDAILFEISNPEQVAKLRSTISQFLKKKYPNDEEKLIVFYCSFDMWRELGEYLLNKSRGRIQEIGMKLSEDEFTNAKIVKENNHELKEIGQALFNAGDAFETDGSLVLAQKCACFASLVGLQMRVPRLKVIQLENRPYEIRHLISFKIHNFFDCLIILEYYDLSNLDSWAGALFNQVVVNDSWVFLTNYFQVFHPDFYLFKKIADLFKNYKDQDAVYHNMHRFLDYLEDGNEQYEISKELGFEDVMDELDNMSTDENL
ncbi:spatacsin [Anaeramoeba ignava]|uniref:Spatacsin n=1 Tax=Anaeramoeba ignava TaxID=1746090 RepID=A0A9Q0LCI2_ANAIG|nr:spatacsin [Anaeramoeba ignava]